MAHRLLEDLRCKLLARLDSLNKKRGQFQDVNCFIEFRNASGVPQGEPVDLVCFERALRQFDVDGSNKKSLMKSAFSLLTRKDDRGITDDTSITFNHFKEWCAVRDANQQRAKRKKYPQGIPTSPTPRSNRSGFGKKSGDDLLLTGRSMNTARQISARAPLSTGRSNTSQRRSHNSSRAATPKKKDDPIVMVDGHELKVSQLYIMLKTKIIGKHPGGSHGLLRCWKQFRSMAGSGRGGGGGKGAGVITKDELGVCFRNYGLELDESKDLDMLFQKFDVNQDGVIDLDDWLEELFGKWSSSVNTFGDDSREIYEGLVYKPMEYLDIPVKDVFKMLREKIASRMKGTAYPARRGWNQFRTMSGGHTDGVNEADLGQALRYYGMPVNDETLRNVFNQMDIQKNGLVTYSEFRETVLDEMLLNDGLDMTAGSSRMPSGAEKEGTEEKEAKDSSAEDVSRLAGLDTSFTDMVSMMETGRSRVSSSRKSNHSVLSGPHPGALHASVQEKVRCGRTVLGVRRFVVRSDSF